MAFGDCFKKINDPILMAFLNVWGKTDRNIVESRLVSEYAQFKRKIKDQIAYLAEIYMSQVLWNGQRKVFDKKLFHSNTDIQMAQHCRQLNL